MESYFDISANVYSKGRPTYPAELYLWLSKQVKSQACAWDCACGTGQVSVDLTAYFEHVEANDISESQIAEATPHRKIRYQVSSSERTPYLDKCFDVICVGQALHCFDLNTFWVEMKRTLKPGGIFACWGYSGLKVSNDIDNMINHQILRKLKPYWPEQNKIIWNRYSSVDFPLEMIDVPTFELSLKWNAHRVFDYIKTWSALRAMTEEDTHQLLDDAWQAILQVWQDPNEKYDVKIPFFVKAGRLAS